MTELRSEDVKNAVTARLLESAPECAVYKEAVTSPAYPHFFVHLISVTDEEQRKRRHILSYSFDLRYRVASDPSTDLKLLSGLDAMALRLMAAMDIIPCGDVMIRCEDKSYEKTDGVLHFFLTVRMQAMLKDTADDTEKLGKLEVSVATRG